MKRTIIIVALLLIAVSLYTWQKSSGQNPAVVSQPSPSNSLVPPSSVANPAASPSPTAGDTANWKTYRNDKYGFEVKYPDNAIEETDNGVIYFWNKDTYNLLKSNKIPEAFPMITISMAQPAPTKVNQAWLDALEPGPGGNGLKLQNHKESIGGREALVARDEESGGHRTLLVLLKEGVIAVDTLDDLLGSTDFLLSNQILSTFKFTK